VHTTYQIAQQLHALDKSIALPVHRPAISWSGVQEFFKFYNVYYEGMSTEMLLLVKTIFFFSWIPEHLMVLAIALTLIRATNLYRVSSN
jgi:hypothetical protein